MEEFEEFEIRKMVIMKKSISLIILVLILVLTTGSAVNAKGFGSLVGAVIGAPIGAVVGMMRGAGSKGMEYSKAICQKYGGGIPVMMFAVPTGMISGGLAGGATGMVKGVTDGVSIGADDPFSAASFSMAGDSILDYEPYDIGK